MLRKLREARDEEGFTLIELLVVVLIIGILAAIAIPVFLNQRQKAYRDAVSSDVRNLALAVEDYATDNAGSYDINSDLDGDGTPDPLEYVVSDGVTLDVYWGTAGADGYCIVGAHSTFGGAESWEYDASTGAANALVEHDDSGALDCNGGTGGSGNLVAANTLSYS